MLRKSHLYILLTHDTVSLMEIENGNKSPRAFELNAFYSFQHPVENRVKQITIWYRVKTAICHSWKLYLESLSYWLKYGIFSATRYHLMINIFTKTSIYISLLLKASFVSHRYNVYVFILVKFIQVYFIHSHVYIISFLYFIFYHIKIISIK